MFQTLKPLRNKQRVYSSDLNSTFANQTSYLVIVCYIDLKLLRKTSELTMKRFLVALTLYVISFTKIQCAININSSPQLTTTGQECCGCCNGGVREQ